jgi:hypothetical protein
MLNQNCLRPNVLGSLSQSRGFAQTLKVFTIGILLMGCFLISAVDAQTIGEQRLRGKVNELLPEDGEVVPTNLSLVCQMKSMAENMTLFDVEVTRVVQLHKMVMQMTGGVETWYIFLVEGGHSEKISILQSMDTKHYDESFEMLCDLDENSRYKVVGAIGIGLSGVLIEFGRKSHEIWTSGEEEGGENGGSGESYGD